MIDPDDSHDSEDFDRLLRDARAGDREATQRLLSRSLAGLRRYVNERDGPDPIQSGADLLQSTCREVLADLHRFDDHGAGEPAFRGWLYATARRKIVDRRRYLGRLKRGGDRAVAHGAGPDLESLLHHSRSPSRDAAHSEQVEVLRRAMETLPGDYAEVLRLAYFEGLPRELIRERTGRPTVDAVQSLIARALARLAVTVKRMSDG